MALLRLTTAGGAVAASPPPLVEITLADWRAGVRPEGRGFALVLPPGAAPDEIGSEVARFEAVILTFPTFRDGRAYSQAMILRSRIGYRGDLRARGAVVADQAHLLARAGFTSIEAPAEQAAVYAAARAAYSVAYQAAADGATPAWALRARRAEAA